MGDPGIQSKEGEVIFKQAEQSLKAGMSQGGPGLGWELPCPQGRPLY